MQHIPTDNITTQNELISAEGKLVPNKISIPLRNRKRNTKFEWEMKQKKTNKENVTSDITKEGETYKNLTERKNTKKTTADNSDDTTGSNKSKDFGQEGNSKDTRTESSNTNKTGSSKITKEYFTNMLVESK